MDTLTLCARNMNQIELVVPEIWSIKTQKSGARLFKEAHLFSKIRYAHVHHKICVCVHMQIDELEICVHKSHHTDLQ